MMLSPNEELEKIKKDKSRIKKSAYNYFNKIMNKKYGFLGICDFLSIQRPTSNNVVLYLEENYEDGEKSKIEISFISNYYTSLFCFDDSYIAIMDSMGVGSIKKIKEHIDYKPQYEQAILYFSETENIKNCIEYTTWIHNLIYSTTYINCLPLAYTFLLSNNKTKIFHRDIAKLIVHKLLFFPPPKKLNLFLLN